MVVAVFWYVPPCSACMNLRSAGAYCLYIQCWNSAEQDSSVLAVVYVEILQNCKYIVVLYASFAHVLGLTCRNGRMNREIQLTFVCCLIRFVLMGMKCVYVCAIRNEPHDLLTDCRTISYSDIFYKSPLPIDTIYCKQCTANCVLNWKTVSAKVALSTTVLYLIYKMGAWYRLKKINWNCLHCQTNALGVPGPMYSDLPFRCNS